MKKMPVTSLVHRQWVSPISEHCTSGCPSGHGVSSVFDARPLAASSAKPLATHGRTIQVAAGLLIFAIPSNTPRSCGVLDAPHWRGMMV